ncbi:MAG: alpha/beta hydrolase [Caldilineaceae bacterium]|nr:alpha/beta hydrolase [Caldilineaceae bacterium]
MTQDQNAVQAPKEEEQRRRKRDLVRMLAARGLRGKRTPIEYRSVEIDGSTLYYQEAGEGPPLVLIHGLSGSGRWWRQNVNFLAQEYHVYVIDLIGFGHGRRQRFVLARMAQIITRWMEALEIERAILIGHSMGGFISADLASNHPELVDRLVLVDAAALPMGRTRAQTAVALVRAIFEMPFNFLPILFGDAMQAGPRTIWRAAHELLTSDISARLNRIQSPTLVVWGQNDWLVPLQIGVRIYDRLDDARFVVLPRAGHNPMWDRPDAFNAVLDDFLHDRPVSVGAGSGQATRR